MLVSFTLGLPNSDRNWRAEDRTQTERSRRARRLMKQQKVAEARSFAGTKRLTSATKRSSENERLVSQSPVALRSVPKCNKTYSS